MQDDKKQPKRPKFDWLFIIVIIAAIIGIYFLIQNLTQKTYKNISYTKLQEQINGNYLVEDVQLTASPISDNYDLYYITGQYKNGTAKIDFKSAVTTSQLEYLVSNYNLSITIVPLKTNIWLSLLVSLLPSLILLVVLVFIMRMLMKS